MTSFTTMEGDNNTYHVEGIDLADNMLASRRCIQTQEERRLW